MRCISRLLSCLRDALNTDLIRELKLDFRNSAGVRNDHFIARNQFKVFACMAEFDVVACVDGFI